MTQRIFDTDNEQDMADLWDILPDAVEKITRTYDVWFTNDKATWNVHAIKIEFHDKEYITRPLKEATDADVGKLCVFWDGDTNNKHIKSYGILTFVHSDSYTRDYGLDYLHCRRLTKQEIEELC